MAGAGAAFGAHAARPVSTSARLRFLVSVAYALGLATIGPHSGVQAGIGKRTLADDSTEPCGAVKIFGRSGEFAEYVNGFYSMGGGEVVKVNGRLNYQKARTEASKEHPELFLMFQAGRWYITFFAPGQGKSMTALAYFDDDVLAAEHIATPLRIAGSLDDAVRITCSKVPDGYYMTQLSAKDDPQADAYAERQRADAAAADVRASPHDEL